MLLDKASLSVRHAASKDTSRAQLQNVLVTPTHTVATDGDWLALVTHSALVYQDADGVTAPGAAGPDFASFQVPASTLSAAVKALPKRHKDPTFLHARVNRLACTVRAGDSTVSYKPTEARFPDFLRVIDRGSERVAVRLSVSILESLLKAAREANDNGERELGITVSLSKTDRMSQVQFQSGRFTALVMPMRDGNDGKPVVTLPPLPAPVVSSVQDRELTV